MTRLFRLLIPTLGLVAALTMACGGDSPAATATPTAPASDATSTPTPQVATATPATESTPTPSQGQFGGTLAWGTASEPPTLDMMHTTVFGPLEVSYHVQEKLFHFNIDLEPQPHLATGFSVSDDSLEWTFTLREGISFQNGTPFNATHAVGSLERWMDRDAFARAALAGFIDRIEVVDEYTFTIFLDEFTGQVLEGLAKIGGHEPFMQPPQMYELPPGEVPSDYISGTGPYQFREWRPGDRLIFDRWDGYQPVDAEPSYHSGRFNAYLDTIEIVIVPDTGAQIAALETGQLHFVRPVSPDQRARLDSNPNTRVFINERAAGRTIIYPNHLNGPFSNPEVRRALMMAYPVDEAMFAVFGDRDIYALCPSFMICGSRWGTTRTDNDWIYGARDVEQARQIIRDAGVEGATIRLLTPAPGTPNAEAGLITREVLLELGFEVDYQAVDATTYSATREDPDRWDLFQGGHSFAFAGINPLVNTHVARDGFWNRYQDVDGRMEAAREAYARAADRETQDALILEMQEIAWDELPILVIGQQFPMDGMRIELKNVEDTLPYGRPPMFNNAWLEP